MVRSILEWLSGLVQASPLIAIFGAFLWGVLSILLSPCHLSSIPLVVGFISGQGEITNRRAFSLSFLFALGVLITIALIGVITGLSGRMLGDIGPYGNYIAAVVFFVVGLYLLDVISLPFLGKVGSPQVKNGEPVRLSCSVFYLVSGSDPAPLPIWRRCWQLCLRWVVAGCFTGCFFSLCGRALRGYCRCRRTYRSCSTLSQLGGKIKNGGDCEKGLWRFGNFRWCLSNLECINERKIQVFSHPGSFSPFLFSAV